MILRSAVYFLSASLPFRRISDERGFKVSWNKSGGSPWAEVWQGAHLLLKMGPAFEGVGENVNPTNEVFFQRLGYDSPLPVDVFTWIGVPDAELRFLVGFGGEPSSREFFGWGINFLIHFSGLNLLILWFYFLEDVKDGLFFLFEKFFEDLFAFFPQNNDSIVTCVEPGDFEGLLFCFWWLIWLDYLKYFIWAWNICWRVSLLDLGFRKRFTVDEQVHVLVRHPIDAIHDENSLERKDTLEIDGLSSGKEQMLGQKIEFPTETDFHPGVELDFVIRILMGMELLNNLLGRSPVERVLDVQHVLADHP